MSTDSSSCPPTHCRIDWHPSRLCAAALALLGGLGALSLGLSAAPGSVRAVGAVIAVAWGLRLGLAEARRPVLRLRLAADGRSLRLGAGPRAPAWRALRIRVHGPLAVLAGRDARGRRHRLLAWHDSLGPGGWRALRLAAAAGTADSGPGFATMPG